MSVAPSRLLWSALKPPLKAAAPQRRFFSKQIFTLGPHAGSVLGADLAEDVV